MRKNVFGRRFKRDTNERKALFKSLMSSLVLDGRIKTTEAKAKSIKSGVEKLVTKAKKRGEESERYLSAHLTSPAIDKVIGQIAPQFNDRPGGYTRLVRVGNRITDSAPLVIMEWTEEIINSVVVKPKAKKAKAPKIVKKIQVPKKAAQKNIKIVAKVKAKPKSKAKKVAKK